MRATEFTVGPTGPAAMPAELPPTSAYTYATEFSVDEALAVGAREVQFSQPVVTYVENLLAFPVGSNIPTGSYDRRISAWVPASNGRVVRIVAINNGSADLDVTGSGVASDPATLAALGITSAERNQLALLYAPSQTLWRVPITHFTPWDYNWPYTAGPGAGPPPGSGPQQPKAPDDPDCQAHSIVECQNRVLREQVAITGTAFGLNYNSSRVPGYRAGKALHIPLSGPSIPAGLKNIILVIDAAGKRTVDTFPATANQVTDFAWDGTDIYGRTVPGAVTARVQIRYVYPAVYTSPAAFNQAFALGSDVAIAPDSGQGGGASTIGVRTDATISISREFRTLLGPWTAGASTELGAWTLDVHHAYDPVNKRLYLGDGTQRTASNLALVIQTFAGGGPGCSSGCAPNGDGGPATQASIGSPVGLAVAPDGSVYIAERQFNRIRKVGVNGIITTVAGNGSLSGFGGDGGPATQAMISSPSGIALGPDGSFYIADLSNQRIRRVGPDGIITTVAGNGSFGFSGDSGPATLAQLFNPTGVAVGRDGALYIADQGNQRVRRVSPSGIINTFAGNGSFCTTGFLPPDSFPSICGEGIAATSAKLANPTDVAVAADGSVLIADQGDSHIRRVGTDGIIRTAAGSAAPPGTGDGGPATAAGLSLPRTVQVGSDGSFFIGDGDNNSQDIDKRVRRVGPDGIITTVAGSGVYGFRGDSGPAPQAQVKIVQGVTVAPDGSLYISDTDNNRVRRVGPTLPGLGVASVLLASADGTELYSFDGSGRHQSTLSAVTGDTLYAFRYDTLGRLTSVVDPNRDSTTIERGTDGHPTAIVAPYGQRTTLSVDAAGYLDSIANPAGESLRPSYTPSGLLSTLMNPKGYKSAFAYDSLGRLLSDSGADGGVVHLVTVRADSVSEVSFQSALGRSTTYRIEPTSAGGSRRVMIDPAGLTTTTVTDVASRTTAQFPTGDSISLVLRPDPRWGMESATFDSLWVKTPSAIRLTAKSRAHVTLSNPIDPLSLVSSIDSTALNDQWTTTTYDASTRRVVATSPEGRHSFETLDQKGRIVAGRRDGLDSVLFTYDGRGRAIKVQLGGQIWTYGYDDRGRLSTTSDPLGRRDSLFYDNADRLTRYVFPTGRELLFAYDLNGNITSLTPPGRPQHGFQYTSVDLASQYDPPGIPGPKPTRYFYNLERRLDSIVRPDSLAIRFAYDTAGRASAVTFDRGTVSFGYSASTGNLIGMRTPTGDSTTFTYDGWLPNEVRWVGSVSGRVGVTYNNEFRIATQTVNGANAVSFGYDRDGMVTSAGALRLGRSTLNGLLTADTLGSVRSTYQYTSHGELRGHHVTAGAATLFGAGYVRDSLGRILQLFDTTGGTPTRWSYVYDSVGNLGADSINGAVYHVFTYDQNGNRLSYTSSNGTVNYSYDSQDRLLGAGTTSYTYGSSGELKTKTLPAIGTTTYTYDGLGNLVRVLLPDGTQIDYVIDGQNRRIGRKVNGSLVQGWLYQNQLNPVAELDGSGNVVSRFVYGSRANVPDYLIKNGVTYRIVADQLGSVRLVVDTSTGVVVQRIDYDEWGNVSQNTNPGFQPFGFVGGLYDSQTGLVRLGARDYDPGTGRWTAKDPILFGGADLELYGYTRNDPVNMGDPSGLLFGGLINAGECAGESAARYWAQKAAGEGSFLPRLFDNTMGLFASLWTPETSDYTFAVLTTALGVSRGAPRVEIGHWGSPPGPDLLHFHWGTGLGLQSHHLPYELLSDWLPNLLRLVGRDAAGADLANLSLISAGGVAAFLHKLGLGSQACSCGEE